MAMSDLELLARLIQCEAGGEGDAGMRAVASVVMNRVNSAVGEYERVSQGGNLRNIVYQPYQFQCALDDNRGQNIYNMSPEAIHYDIALWALLGNRLPDLGEALWFFNPYSPQCPASFPSRVGTLATRIGDHCFYNPTRYYADT